MKKVPAVRLCVVFVSVSSAVEDDREISLHVGTSDNCKTIAEEIEEACSNVPWRVEAQHQQDMARQTGVEESRGGHDWSDAEAHDGGNECHLRGEEEEGNTVHSFHDRACQDVWKSCAIGAKIRSVGVAGVWLMA